MSDRRPSHHALAPCPSQPVTEDSFVSAGYLKRVVGISRATLARWGKAGYVRTQRPTNLTRKKHYRYGDITRQYNKEYGIQYHRTRDRNLKRVVPDITAFYFRTGPRESQRLMDHQKAFAFKLHRNHRWFADTGCGGYDPQRPQFKQLMNDVYDNQILTIHVTSLDRLGTLNIDYVLETLKKLNVSLVTHEEEFISYVRETNDLPMVEYLESIKDDDRSEPGLARTVIKILSDPMETQ